MKSYNDKDLSPMERSRLLLGEMSLQEKMGQVVCWMPQTLGYYDELAANYPDGVGHISCLVMRELQTLEDCISLQRDIQKQAMALSEHHIPAIFHMEGLCGAYLSGATSFPSGLARASGWNPALEKEIARIVGRQERAVGITQTFAPVLDISRDSRMGRQGETYGEDPTLAAALGAAYTQGLQGEATGALHTDAVAKHFLGFHASEGGIHGAACDISPRQMREVYAKPFQAAITKAGLKGIMPCYNSINGEPVSASEEIMTKLLREEMGFEGLVVSDYCAVMNIHTVQRAAETFTEAGWLAMQAGMDVELQFTKCYNAQLAEWFASGKADIGILDRAVERVLTAKFRMGLFEQPFAMPADEARKVFISAKDKQVSLQSALESMTLIKNDGILPINRGAKRIAVIGCHAGSARYFYGGYTHFSMEEGAHAARSSMAGLEETANSTLKHAIETIPGTPIQKDSAEFEDLFKSRSSHVKNLLEQLREAMPDTDVVYAYGYPVAGDDMKGHEEALELAKTADCIIMTAGGKHGTSSIASMGEGIDATDIGLPVCQEQFIEKLAKIDKPFAIVHFNGRPISSDAADRYAGAILEAWNPSEAGAEAITSVLLGEYNPGGKLPVSVAYNAGQIPIYYNHSYGSSYHQGESIGFPNYVDCSHSPRYAFGHGLSYTCFRYQNMLLNTAEVSGDGQLTVSCEVENTGTLAGDEVVQLYVKDNYASVTRPNMSLIGFKRVKLEPRQRKQIIFTVSMSLMAFLDKDMRWKVEAGTCEILIGASSDDIRLQQTCLVQDDNWVDGQKREFYALASEKNI